MTAPESDQTINPTPGVDNPNGETKQPVDEHERPQHHVSKLLDEVLEEPAVESTRFRHPMLLDIVLAVGLLMAVGAFTAGLFKMYLVNSAERSIWQHDYKAAIAVLKGVSAPDLFSVPGADPDELLSQALYLDAMDKIEAQDIDGALKELQQVSPGSRYFSLAQEIIEENFTPSDTQLLGGASVTEKAAPPPRKPLLPEEPQDGSP